MIAIDVLAASISFAGTFAAIVLAAAAIQALRYFRIWQREQRQVRTIRVLSDYRERMIVPTQAISDLSPEEFANREFSDSYKQIFKTELLNFLNSMEYLALTIRSGAIDEDLCFRFMRGDITSSFKRTLAHILAAREAADNPRIYSEYEALARKWGQAYDL